jgi:AbrB family looped-hinge helix DNA binding protein
MYLTFMKAHTRLSAKGQIVIPKAVRDRLQWREGADLEVIETASGVLLRPLAPKRERITMEEFRRRHPPQPGPVLTVEQMNEAVMREARRRYELEYKREP